MWKWTVPTVYAEIIRQNYFSGDGSLMKTLQEIAANEGGIPSSGAHQLYEDIYMIRVNDWIVLYERMPEPRLLILADLSEIDTLLY